MSTSININKVLGSTGGTSITKTGGPPVPPPTPPVNTVSPLISGADHVGGVLSTTDGTWTGTPTITYSYQWRRNAVTNIGFNSNSYTLVQADAGQLIDCVVTATNAIGSGASGSNPYYIYDLDARNFIVISGISNITQLQAINNLVIGLKLDSLWFSMKAIYPFVGGTASTHKWNLRFPNDTNLSHRLTFSGGWTHSSNGATPDGTTAFANTYFTPSSNGGFWTLVYGSISVYSRTNSVNSGSIYGTRTASTATNVYTVLNVSSTSSYSNTNVSSSPFPLPTTTACNFISSRTSTTNVVLAINGTASNYTSTSNSLSTVSIYLGARNNNGTTDLFSNRQIAFAHIGTGFTTTQCTQLYNRIQTFQTALGRNV